MYRTKRANQGFTLIEAMIVVVIVAILASIALPAYQDSVRKSKRADAQGALLGLANAMERYFTTNGSYTGADAATIFSAQVPTSGGTAYYTLSITANNGTSYTLRATAVGSMAGDGNMELTSTGIRRWDEGNDGTFAGNDLNWVIN